MLRRLAPSKTPAPLLIAVVLCGVVLAACAPTPEPGNTPSAAPTPAGSESPAEPVLVPDGTAADNLPLFTAVTTQVWATEDRASGRAYVDALVAAGFTKADMQVTEDLTTVGNPAESIQFSVRWGEDECLVGQVGPSTGEPVTVALPQLGEGQCLLGATRDIDW